MSVWQSARHGRPPATHAATVSVELRVPGGYRGGEAAGGGIRASQVDRRAPGLRPRVVEVARRAGLRNRERGVSTEKCRSALGATRRPALCWATLLSMSRERIDDKIDEAVLSLLYLGIFEREPMMSARTWKSFDWDAMERLHRKGLISDPVSKAKSVVFTDTGLRRAEAAFRRLFEADE